MRIKLEEFQKTSEEYSAKLTETKFAIVESLKDSLVSQDEIKRIVGRYMKPFLVKYWKHKEKEYDDLYLEKFNCPGSYCRCDADLTAKISLIIEKELSTLIEIVTVPIDETFYKLHGGALEQILSDQPIEMYKKAPEHFKAYFKLTDDKRREEIVSAIHDIESQSDHNKELDEWLSENYSSLCNKKGMDSLDKNPANS